MYTRFMALRKPFRKTGPRPGIREPQQPRSPLGERLLHARLEAGLTQSELAEQLGTTQRVIAHWERLAVEMRADQLAALADALGVTADYLLGREEARPLKGGPSGRTRKVFEEVSALPRSQQQSIVELVEVMLRARLVEAREAAAKASDRATAKAAKTNS